ncbi:MAG: TIGR00730 family Rossman fold protein [Pirellulales bacterium]
MSESHPDLKAILDSPSFVLAERDTAFLARTELRPVRLQLELLKPEMALADRGIDSTIVVFGSLRILDRPVLEQRRQSLAAALAAGPGDARVARDLAKAERLLAKADYYDAARRFAEIASSRPATGGKKYVIVTGGGSGIMEAANRGAYDAGATSIGLNIILPTEQAPNPYITPELCFQFHYFALRKMHFLMRARALVVFPGGFGTLDELFDALTLRQTRRMQEIPIIMYSRSYWERVIDFQFLADEAAIADEDLELVSYAETPEEIWNIIARFHHFEP